MCTVCSSGNMPTSACRSPLYTSAYASIRQHTSACPHSIRQHTPSYVSIRDKHLSECRLYSIRQHTSAYVSIRGKHLSECRLYSIHHLTSAYVSIYDKHLSECRLYSWHRCVAAAAAPQMSVCVLLHQQASTLVPVSKHFCTRKASEHLATLVTPCAPLPQNAQSQYSYFCSSKASKLSTWRLE
jgi:hypothetical protein